MIANIAILVLIVVIVILIAQRIPSAREKLHEERQVSNEEISLYSIIAQADEAFEKGKFQEAENLYVKAASQDPDNPKIYSRLGAIYLEEKNFYDAKDAFLQAVKLEPDLASRHVNLGLAYVGLKDFFKAIESFKKANSIDPKNSKYKKLLERAQKYLEKEKK